MNTLYLFYILRIHFVRTIISSSKTRTFYLTIIYENIAYVFFSWHDA